MKIRKNGFLKTGGIMSLVLATVIVTGFFWTPYGTTAMNAAEKTLPHSLHHLLGTDNFGRDVLSRVISGAGTSFLIALGVVAVGCIGGVLIGSLCGYFGGIADAVLMRVCDAITAFPAILLALVVVSLFGGGMANILLCLGLLFIPSFARIVRTEVAKQKNTDYVRSAKLMGASDMRILLLHILPNIVPVLLSSIAIGFNNAVLAEASMSYLGVGVQPPDPSLGRMLSEAQGFLSGAPWYAISVGVAIIFLILGFGLLSEGLGGDDSAR